jgi:hypothetical protein
MQLSAAVDSPWVPGASGWRASPMRRGVHAPGGGIDAIVLRMDPATNQVAATIQLGGQSGSDVAVAVSGVWILIFAGPNEMAVVRLDASDEPGGGHDPRSRQAGVNILK